MKRQMASIVEATQELLIAEPADTWWTAGRMGAAPRMRAEAIAAIVKLEKY